jgi:dihydroorotate dehydrogenase (NAD+) catalytic subunit
MAEPNLAVDLNGLKFKNPVLTASGTFGYGLEYAPYLDLNLLGGIVVKGLSLWEEQGNIPPRIWETPSGMLNAIGLQNIGVERFIKEKLPELKEYDTAIIANIWGKTIDDYLRVAERLENAGGIAALEVNISCPNIKKGGISFGVSPDSAYDITRRLKSSTSLFLIVKLTPNVTDIEPIAKAVEEGGADAISLINTLIGMAVDVEAKKPRLRNITGGLSGPAIKPVALRMVYETVKNVRIPVIGIGGIMNLSDALEFLIVGAKAIEIGTANFVNPRITIEIIEGLRQYLRERNIHDVNKIIATLKVD